MKMGGGYSKSEISKGRQRNLGVSFKVWDHNYCRIPLKRVECNGRLGISKQFGFIRLDAESSKSQKVCQVRGFLEIDLFASCL